MHPFVQSIADDRFSILKFSGLTIFPALMIGAWHKVTQDPMLEAAISYGIVLVALICAVFACILLKRINDAGYIPLVAAFFMFSITGALTTGAGIEPRHPLGSILNHFAAVSGGILCQGQAQRRRKGIPFQGVATPPWRERPLLNVT